MLGVNRLPLEIPRQKKESLVVEPPDIILLKALTLSLRVSPSVYEGVSGKLACGTKVATPIRSLFCNAALLAA